MSALSSEPATPARGGPSDRAERSEEGLHEFHSPDSRRKPTGHTAARATQRKVAHNFAQLPTSARKRRLEETDGARTPATKRILQAREAISERTDKVSQENREPAVQRKLDFNFMGSDGVAPDFRAATSESWIQMLIKDDIIEAIVRAAAVPTWSKIPQRDQNAFAGILTQCIDKAMGAGIERERVEGWYEIHFLFHLFLRQTPTFSRDSKLSETEKLKKADQIIHERLQQFKRGHVADLVHEYHADIQVWKTLIASEKSKDSSSNSNQEGSEAKKSTTLTAKQADRFCIVGKSQPGKALKLLTSPPIIPDCEALRKALPTKILPVSGSQEDDLAKLRERIPELQALITDEMRGEVEVALGKRAERLKAHSQPGFTGQKNEHLRTINRGPAGQKLRKLAVHFLEGRAPSAVYALYATPALIPRYKPATMSPEDPRPVGSPEPFYRWAVGALIDTRKEKAARELAPAQFAIGVSGGSEAMVHACTLDATENPELTFMSPDVKNAYGELDRAEFCADAIEFDPFVGLTATAVYSHITVYIYVSREGGHVVLKTAVGCIQGDPIGMLGFVLSYKKPNVWIVETLRAAAAGEKIIPAMNPPPPPHIAESLQVWLHEHTLQKPPSNMKVIERQFADNGVFGICPELADFVPSLAEFCLKEKGLQYKKSWDVWSQTPFQFANPFFHVRPPHEGLVVLGGLVHDIESVMDVEVIIGKDSFLEKHVDSFVEKIEVVAEKFTEVITLAAQAHHAERICFKVFVNTMKQRATYFLRVFPPEVSRKAAKRLSEIFQNVTRKLLGWTPQEWEASAGQAQLHPEDGGHGEANLSEDAPLLHLASWLGTTHVPNNQENRCIVPLAHFFEVGVFSQRMNELYHEVQKINATLPDSLEIFAKQVLAKNQFQKKVKGGGRRTLWGKALADGTRETKLNLWTKSASIEQKERVREMKGNWILLEPPVARSFGRKTWLVAMRFRYGLSIEPVFLPRKPSSVCVSQRSWGEKRKENLGCCAAQLDSKGRHAVTCPVGGKTIRRHDTIVHRLAELLKKFVISCATEVYIFELEQICPETGEWTEAKLDLEVVTQDGRYLLDVSVFHAFQKGAKGKERYVKLREREKRKYERYPMHKDGQRVTDAALVPIILNTFGGVGEKATEFLYAVAGSEAKRIIEEISMLAVLLSAEMILQSHAPSNLSNLLSLSNPSGPAAEPVEQPDAGEGEGEEIDKDEAGFLRPELRGESKGSTIECLGCSCSGKQFFTTAARWNWNRHVMLKHKPQPASGQDAETAAEPAAEQAALSQQKRQPARRSKRVQGDSASAAIAAPAPPPAPQNLKVSTRGKADSASAEISALAPTSAAPQKLKVSRRGKRDSASDEISSPAPQLAGSQSAKLSRRGKGSSAGDEISSLAPPLASAQVPKVSRRGNKDSASAEISASAPQPADAHFAKVSRCGHKEPASAQLLVPAPTSVEATMQPALQRALAKPSVVHTILKLPAQPPAQSPRVPPQSVDSEVNFRTSAAKHRKVVENVIDEERYNCETVPSINIDRNRSQAEAYNSRVKHFDSSAPTTGSDDAASSALIFSKTNDAFQMFSSTEN